MNVATLGQLFYFRFSFSKQHKGEQTNRPARAATAAATRLAVAKPYANAADAAANL
jgi:hypothetical protein